MHIALWAPAWPLEKFQNGIITYVHWLKLEFEAQGHRVSVFTERLDPSAENDARVYRVRRSRWQRAVRQLSIGRRPPGLDVFDFPAVIADAILRVHRRDPIDVIEMEESFGWFADVHRLTRLPLLVKLHGPAFLSLVEDELDTPFARVKIEREGQALQKADAIISPCHLTLVQTIERYQLAPKRRRHIVNPLAMDDDTPLWTLDGCDRHMILFVGRFDLRKGADVLLTAFLTLLIQRPMLKLVFVGPDSGLPGADGKQLKIGPYCDLLFPAKLREQVNFRGPMANPDIAQWRARSMMTVVASRWENTGYTLLEAMLQGCPVVSTDAGGCPESIIDGVTGRLAKSGDPSDFAAKMAAILDDPKGAESMGREARRHVAEQHSATRVVAETLEMYRAIISS